MSYVEEDIVEEEIDEEEEEEEENEEEEEEEEEDEDEEEEEEEEEEVEIKDEPCEEYKEELLQKFSTELDRNMVMDLHPREKAVDYEYVKSMCSVVRKEGVIVDPNHTTIPLLTKFEYTKVLGVRATQIDHGAPLFIEADPSIIDSYVLALMELTAKKLPFIIRRPLPGGKMEYWKINDLENLLS